MDRTGHPHPGAPADRRGRPTVDDIAQQISEPSTDRPFIVERKDTGEVIGYCGLVHGTNGPQDEPELAFELLKSQHGQGYATEAGRAVVEASRAAGYAHLWAGVWEWNTASRRVLAKLGFHEVSRDDSQPEHGTNLLTSLDLTPWLPR